MSAAWAPTCQTKYIQLEITSGKDLGADLSTLHTAVRVHSWGEPCMFLLQSDLNTNLTQETLRLRREPLAFP